MGTSDGSSGQGLYWYRSADTSQGGGSSGFPSAMLEPSSRVN